MTPIPVIDPETKVDFYAGNDKSYRNLVPLWKALDGRRGTFYVSHLVHPADGFRTARLYHKFCGYNPIVINSYSDLNNIFPVCNDHPFIMFETGYEYESRGLLKAVSFFLCDNAKTFDERKTININTYLFDGVGDASAKLNQYLKSCDVNFIDSVNGKSAGIVYMGFGERSLRGIEKSILSLRRTGYSYPVVIVGDVVQRSEFMSKCKFIKYQGQSPFDLSQKKNFRFRAGRIKPRLCDLSPFDYNLYIDADTEFIQPIQSAFELLESNDICIAQEKLTLEKLYNKMLAGWEINIKERDLTVKELGENSAQRRFINSGVIFFKKNEKTLRVFADWYLEWMRFQQWDEQLALMRAINKNDAQVKYLGIDWNSPHKTASSIIFHNYGRGVVRANV